ncbi:DUF481 domain-containing protein [Pedobacter sp. HMF7647]|uniref:DUF481 domain-containing protein n=2 Tax=Hufsiella arboris TaxID=2695275 RepID=A0A7K1YEF7_9SPHI|nr:DUF481 domain-containing protein [Hufsiella arboris]
MLFFFILCHLLSFAQFTDSTHYYVNFTLGGNINKTDDADSYLLNNALRFSVKKKRVTLNASNSWLYGNQDSRLTNNDYTATLDFNLYAKNTKLYYWGLGNYTTSYSLKINNQLQTGIGAAYNLVNNDNNYLNISDGILFETSDLFLDDSTRERYTTFRNSLRLSFKWTVKEIIVLSGTGFLQNSLQYKSDYIIKGNTALKIKLRKWLGLTSSLTYNHFARTNKENLLFTYGLTIEKYF